MFERPVYQLLFEFHHFDIQGTGQNSQHVNTALKRLLILEICCGNGYDQGCNNSVLRLFTKTTGSESSHNTLASSGFFAPPFKVSKMNKSTESLILLSRCVLVLAPCQQHGSTVFQHGSTNPCPIAVHITLLHLSLQTTTRCACGYV